MEDRPESSSAESLPERLRREAGKTQPSEDLRILSLLEAQIQACQVDIKNLENEVHDLRAELKAKKTKEKWEKVWYFAPLLVAIAFTAYVVKVGWAEKPTVSIDYNVGEIIGGLLVGIGTLMAGAAYAFRRLE